jgi:hypothetical protein
MPADPNLDTGIDGGRLKSSVRGSWTTAYSSGLERLKSNLQNLTPMYLLLRRDQNSFLRYIQSRVLSDRH